ncbi:MBL fold metallo-hydrolase [Phragmitibacter flavus]|nr:MBL fold metallo-hydrolase [Phragmitibacter flavus]
MSLGLSACSSYHPLADKEIYPRPLTASPGEGVKVSFFGNTTILISDGDTHLLVDGFFSRPGPVRTLLGKIAPDRVELARELKRAGISNIDAVLVGHAHHDHALDAPVVAEMTNALVMGTESYRQIHLGAGSKTDGEHLFTVPTDGEQKSFGKFVVTFRPSDHVGAHGLVQHLIEGHIKKPFKTPARFWRFKCGKVYVIHIAHPHGNLVVTTTAGAKEGQLKGFSADVVFLGVGFLDKESPLRQNRYWHETVGVTKPEMVVPVHWDNFSIKLSKGLQPAPRVAFSTRAAADVLKDKAGDDGPVVRAMDYGDSLLLRDGQVRTVSP